MQKAPILHAYLSRTLLCKRFTDSTHPHLVVVVRESLVSDALLLRIVEVHTAAVLRPNVTSLPDKASRLASSQRTLCPGSQKSIHLSVELRGVMVAHEHVHELLKGDLIRVVCDLSGRWCMRRVVSATDLRARSADFPIPVSAKAPRIPHSHLHHLRMICRPGADLLVRHIRSHALAVPHLHAGPSRVWSRGLPAAPSSPSCTSDAMQRCGAGRAERSRHL